MTAIGFRRAPRPTDAPPEASDRYLASIFAVPPAKDGGARGRNSLAEPGSWRSEAVGAARRYTSLTTWQGRGCNTGTRTPSRVRPAGNVPGTPARPRLAPQILYNASNRTSLPLPPPRSNSAGPAEPLPREARRSGNRERPRRPGPITRDERASRGSTLPGRPSGVAGGLRPSPIHGPPPCKPFP
jgi:hypothetical protein